MVISFIVGMDGQVSVLCAPGGPCYRCLHPSPPLATRSCAEAGVLGPVPGLIGCLQAMEVIKILVSRSTHTHPSSSTSSSEQLHPLINRQCYYDGARGEFFNFKLPGRDPKCVSCSDDLSVIKIRSMTDSENNITTMLSYIQTCSSLSTKPLPILHADNTVSMTSFYKTLSEEARVDSVCILLDVRSDVQYNIGSYEYYRKPPYAHTTTASSSAQSTSVNTHMNTILTTDNNSLKLRHIPYITLISYTTYNDIYNNILNSSYTDTHNTNNISISCNVTVYVICRKGNDSIRATNYLLSIIGHNSDPYPDGKLKIVNVEGGVTAWQREIDSSFPII